MGRRCTKRNGYKGSYFFAYFFAYFLYIQTMVQVECASFKSSALRSSPVRVIQVECATSKSSVIYASRTFDPPPTNHVPMYIKEGKVR